MTTATFRTLPDAISFRDRLNSYPTKTDDFHVVADNKNFFDVLPIKMALSQDLAIYVYHGGKK
jgi:hypothetical protein